MFIFVRYIDTVSQLTQMTSIRKQCQSYPLWS